MYEACDICGIPICRDTYVATSDPPTTAWFGVCGCENRKWRWRSVTGDAPWELVG